MAKAIAAKDATAVAVVSQLLQAAAVWQFVGLACVVLAGIAAERTVETNEFLQTKYPNIYAAGDVAGGMMLASTGAMQGRHAALFACGIDEDALDAFLD